MTNREHMEQCLENRNGLQDATLSFVGILHHPSFRGCWDEILDGTPLLPLVRFLEQ